MRCPACNRADLEQQEHGIEFCPACCWVFLDRDYDLPFFVPEEDNQKCGEYEREHRAD